MFRDLYAAEVDYLYRLCERLGAEHPRTAPMLGRGADVGVSRLVQSVAFAAARLRQRIDDDAPEWIQPLVDSLCPELLRPFPSATVLELMPDPAMKEPEVVSAGSHFASRPVDGRTCLFGSAVDVEVRPWKLTSVRLVSERSELRLGLSILEGAKMPALTGPLRLFLAMPLAAALELRSILLHGVVDAIARPLGPGRTDAVMLHATTSAPFRPCVPVSLPAARAVRDPRLDLLSYFAWPESFAFVELGDLALLGTPGAVEIVVRLREPLPQRFELDTTSIRLHCVPAFNVYPAATLNLSLAGTRCDVEMGDPEAEVYAIERVALVRSDLTTQPVEPFARFFPPPPLTDGRMPLLYRVERSPSVLDAAQILWLTFVSLDPRTKLEKVASVDVDVLATDGPRAARVGVGDVCVPTPKSPSLVSFRNLTPVTRSAPAALAGDGLWRWLKLLRATFPQLTNAHYLADALALVNVAAAASWPEAKPDATSFRPLRAVRSERAMRAGRREGSLGARVSVDLDPAAFAGSGDVELFGERLAALLATSIRPHEWVVLRLCDLEGVLVREYPSLQGSRHEL